MEKIEQKELTNPDVLRRLSLAACLCVNFGMLLFFKYVNFVIRIIRSIGHIEIKDIEVILPAGISFLYFNQLVTPSMFIVEL